MTNIKLTINTATDENNIQNAIKQGIFFFENALNCEYKKYSSEEATSLLQTSYSLLNDESLLQLLYDERKLPKDVYIDTTMKPSYALAAISIWAYTLGNQFFDNPENIKMFFKLLNACLKFKLEDHGYESEIGKLSNLLVFCKAGIKSLIEQNNPAYQPFTDFFKKEIETLKAQMDTYKNTGKGIYCFAFEPYKATAKIAQILAAYEGKTNTIFAYGTLMKPFPANKHFLNHSIYCGNFSLTGYAIYDLGSYPAIRAVENKTTYGEVWFVDEATLLLLDNYENEGSLYSRQKVTVNSIHGSFESFVYVYNGNFTGYPVDGRWQHTEEDTIWYACYGSNLSAERFSYYIKGGHYKGKDYTGCKDKTLWQESYWQNFPGKMYFAHHSPRWENGGVAFYAHKSKGRTIMRLYKITRQQLEEIQRQESRSWYDKILFLGFGYDGYPIYTLTNSKLLLENIPCQSYRSLIETALTEECGLSDETAKTYLNNCHL